jgi:hypothetical protein
MNNSLRTPASNDAVRAANPFRALCTGNRSEIEAEDTH